MTKDEFARAIIELSDKEDMSFLDVGLALIIADGINSDNRYKAYLGTLKKYNEELKG